MLKNLLKKNFARLQHLDFAKFKLISLAIFIVIAISFALYLGGLTPWLLLLFLGVGAYLATLEEANPKISWTYVIFYALYLPYTYPEVILATGVIALVFSFLVGNLGFVVACASYLLMLPQASTSSAFFGGVLLVMVALLGLAYKRRLESREEILKEERRKAEHAVETKNAFLANMGHEIRTPLNAIVGVSELLKETNPTAKQAEFFDTIHRASDQLLEIVNSAVDIVKIDAKNFELESVPFDFEEMVYMAVEAQIYRAHQCNNKIRVDCTKLTHRMFLGDSIRLQKILYALISNAVKFTRDGVVDIEVNDKDLGDGFCRVCAVVRDTGIGMTVPERARIFDRFYQADTSLTRTFEGTGLGLSICKSLIDALGGDILVKSVKGVGSVFTVCFRLEVAGDEIAPPDAEELAKAKEWEDASIAVFGSPEFLETLVDLPFKFDGHGSDHHFYLIDGSSQNGVEVARTIIDRDPKGVIALVVDSAHATDLTAAKAAGVSHIIHNPVEFRSILKVLQSSHKEGGEVQHVNKRILIVDDSENNRNLFSLYLKKGNYDIFTAENGLQGFEAVKEGNYDLILMDIHMPVMDGFTSMREILNWERENDKLLTPVIIITAHDTPDHRREGRSLENCAGFFSKPIKKKRFVRDIDQFFLLLNS